LKNARIRQEACEKPSIFKPLPRPGTLMREHRVGSITNQPYAAMDITWELVEFMERPEGGRRDAFE
jgi:hypothetical protein